MLTRSFIFLRESQKYLKTKKNMNALNKKVHQEKEVKGE
jgi:hypothetical protein